MHNGNGKLNFAAKRKTVAVDIPELGETIYLRALSVGQLRSFPKDDNDANRPTRQLALAIVDADGRQVYNTDDDIANLNEMSITVFDRLIQALNELHETTVPQQDQQLKN